MSNSDQYKQKTKKKKHNGQICLQYPCERLHNMGSIYCAVTLRLNCTIKSLSEVDLCK